MCLKYVYCIYKLRLTLYIRLYAFISAHSTSRSQVGDQFSIVRVQWPQSSSLKLPPPVKLRLHETKDIESTWTMFHAFIAEAAASD